MPLAPNARIGPYQIQAVLGAGGMGEVYRARDPRLGRDVAIKVLPAAFSADPDRLRRFEHEARAAAALNHPNILTVHEIGTHEGQPYIVSELLEGQTLRDAIASGPSPIKKAVDYAIQICRGLAAAHEKGIVHRDLKPENLFVTTDGRIKILDFGLAKLTEVAVVGDGVTMLAGTRAPDTTPGLVMGTVGYMSPEQVRAQTVDHRSDIFSFGAILYEVLSGSRAFSGDTAADTMSAILGQDPPDLTASRGTIPPALERIVRHCLEKAPSQRFQSAGDVALAMDSALATAEWPASTTGALARRTRRRSIVTSIVVALAAALVGGAGVGFWMLRRELRVSGDQLSIIEVARLTHDGGFSSSPSWSPDGTGFAFSSNREGNFEIYVRHVESGEAVNITHDVADDVQPAYAPNGTFIAFVSTRKSKTRLIRSFSTPGYFLSRTYGGDIWIVPSLGGQAWRLAPDGNYPAWRPDSQAVAYVSGPENHRAIIEVGINGGSGRPLLSSTASQWEITRIRYAPGGIWLTFETTDGRVLGLPTNGGAPQELVRGYSHEWEPSGARFYYVKTLSAGGVRLFSAEVRTVKGALNATVSPVGIVTGVFQDLSVSPDGRRLLASEQQESLNLTRLPLAPGGGAPNGPEEELSPSGQVRDSYPSVSPNGQRVLIGSNRLGPDELWMLTLDSRTWQRIQLPQATCTSSNRGSWDPDGQHIAVSCNNQNDKTSAARQMFSVWYIAIDGSMARELVSNRYCIEPSTHIEISPDGKSLVYSSVENDFNQLFVLDLATGRQRQVTTSRFHKYDGRWSPDSQTIVYAANTGDSIQAWRVAAQGGTEEQLTFGHERMRHVFFSPDGRWVYVQPSHRNIYRLPASGGALHQVTNFPESGLLLEEPTISPDGRSLFYNRSRGGSSLWLLTLGGLRTPASPTTR